MAPDISNNDQLDEIKRLFAENNAALHQALGRLEKYFSDQINSLNKTICNLEKENSTLRDKVEYLERNSRRNNLVIFGLPRTEKKGIELLNWVIEQIKQLLGVKLHPNDISNIYFRGQKENEGKPLVLEFRSWLTKGNIFKNTYKLKGKSISIANDLSKREQEINRVLVTHLREARKKKLSAYIRGSKIHIGEEVFTYEQLVGKPDSNFSDPEFLQSTPKRKSVSAPGTPLPNSQSANEVSCHTEVDISTVVSIAPVPASFPVRSVEQKAAVLYKTKPPNQIKDPATETPPVQPPPQRRGGRLNSAGGGSSGSSPSSTAGVRTLTRAQSKIVKNN